jgi:hypothetical protein
MFRFELDWSQHMDPWRAFVNTVMDLGVAWKTEVSERVVSSQDVSYMELFQTEWLQFYSSEAETNQKAKCGVLRKRKMSSLARLNHSCSRDSYLGYEKEP